MYTSKCCATRRPKGLSPYQSVTHSCLFQSLKPHKSSGKAQEPVKPEERSGTGYTVRDSSNKEIGIDITIEYKGGLRPKTAMAALGRYFLNLFKFVWELLRKLKATNNSSLNFHRFSRFEILILQKIYKKTVIVFISCVWLLKIN